MKRNNKEVETNDERKERFRLLDNKQYNLVDFQAFQAVLTAKTKEIVVIKIEIVTKFLHRLP